MVKSIKASQESIIQTLKDQRTIFENQIAAINKALKKQRRRTRWTAFAGIAVSGLLTYLYIVK
jgi:hypothetical protein